MAKHNNNPRSRQAEGKNADSRSQITKEVKPTLTLNTAPAETVEGYSVPLPVDRDLPEDAPEAARKRANKTRDLRSNLGRGIPSQPVIE